MILTVDQVTKRIGERTILQEVTFDIAEGEVLALCGPSGCGKTTLVRILSGLSDFDQGQVVINDHRLHAGDPYPKGLYGTVGVVFQHHNLFPHLTALENVTLALQKTRKMSKADAQEKGMAELLRMGLESQAKQYPASLSGGERQRVAIARALTMDPFLLLLDEPTSGLDPVLIGEVLESIHELAGQGMTMLLITHNLSFAKETGHRFAVLQDQQLRHSKDTAILDELKGAWGCGF